MHSKRFLLGILGLFGLLWVTPWLCLPSDLSADLRPAAEPRRAVVLVHGLGNDGGIWEAKGYVDQVNGSGELGYAGGLIAGEVVPASTHDGADAVFAQGKTAVFTLSLRHRGEGDIRESAGDLETQLARLRASHGIDSFSLVCKSLGGIVAREYLTSPRYAKDVDRLITIATPHLGSELARLPEIYHCLKETAETWKLASLAVPEGWFDQAGKYCEGKLGDCALETAGRLKTWAAQAKWNVEAPAVRMLVPPTDGTYLAELNARPHPKEVTYVCVVTGKNIANYGLEDIQNDWRRWREGAPGGSLSITPVVTDLFRAIIHLSEHCLNSDAASLAGDGAVSEYSQDLNHIVAFENDPELNATVVHLDEGHHYIHRVLRLPTLLAPSSVVAGPPWRPEAR